ncbi:MAG: riboflavin biosynthesis protein RibF [Caldilineaceae bacterium]|nr:riboflavin biosynthesis protein RibF [Caldilineaceae bacterium]MCB9139831.1 riboflavin biosynthesis protein RibF [Caldilineaceae bacterium]
MQSFNAIRDVRQTGPTYVTIGNFDGLHRGHQALLTAMQELAAAHTPLAATALITFFPHPLTVLRPDTEINLLTTPQERLRLAGEQGIDIGVVQPFDREIAALTPREFVTRLIEHLGMVGLVTGPDFALGRNRTGDLAALAELGRELGYTLHIIRPIDVAGKAVRSSIIRQDLLEGDVEDAARLLGRAYHATGTVAPGDQRGRTIGIPTANILTRSDKLLPADGVYATLCHILPDADGTASPDAWRTYYSVSNLGVRPTVGGRERRLETHLLDFPPPGESDNLYGKTLRLEFIARLRGEKRFNGLDELLVQIQQDIKTTRAIFANIATEM